MLLVLRRILIFVIYKLLQHYTFIQSLRLFEIKVSLFNRANVGFETICWSILTRNVQNLFILVQMWHILIKIFETVVLIHVIIKEYHLSSIIYGN